MLNIYSQQDKNLNQTSKPSAIPKADYRKYVDPSGDFNGREMQYSLWWVKHKVLLYRIAIGLVIIFNIGLWMFGIVRWAQYLLAIGNMTTLETDLTRNDNHTNLQQHFRPNPFQIVSTNLFPGGVNKYDAVAEVENPDQHFMVSFTYAFTLSGTSTEPEQITILPGQRMLVAALGLPADLATSGGAALQIKDQQWKRVSPHKVADTAAYQSERLQFDVANFAYESALLNDGLKVNRLTFSLKNSSAYSYRQADFLVGLYNGGALSGVLPLHLEKFRSMDEVPVDLRSFSSNLQVQNIELFPLINVYDAGVYLSPGK